MHGVRFGKALWVFSVVLTFGLLMSLTAFAQTVTLSAPVSRVNASAINNSNRVTLKGHVRPFLANATDQGKVADGQKVGPIMLMLARTPEQQAALDATVDSLHNRNSSQYHQWLTPAQIGAKFQPTDDDVLAVKNWLISQGFNVLDVSPSKTFISFTGTVGQLRTAFNTDIHHVTINGENHMAAVSEPQIPAALASVVAGLNKLDDFKAKPHVIQGGAFRKDLKTGKSYPVAGTTTSPRANFDSGTGDYEVGPQDFYTIYNENPLLASGITGAGQTIAVIEEVQVAAADVNTFRALFGLPTYPGTPNATAGGVNYYIGSSSGLNGYTSCYAPVTQPAGKTSGEESEADIDLQWAGVTAPNAIIDFVACGGTATSGDGTTLGSLGIDHSAQYIANYLYSTVVAASMSYGECEGDMTQANMNYYNGQWQQFAAEGITAVISSGDGGAEQCYQNSKYATTLTPSVNGFGDSAYNVSAGGTDFGDLYVSNNYTTSPVTTWWNATNGTGYGSAVGYVPETTWAGYCSNALFASYLQKAGSTTYGTTYTPWAICNNRAAYSSLVEVVGGAGGVSTYNTIPSFQSVYGVGLNNVSTTYRNIPDVSWFASNGWWGHFIPYCESDAYACTVAEYDTGVMGAGGTSFVAPQLAGFFALVSQKTGERQGQADYTLYNLAAQQYGTPGSPSATIAACSGSNVATGQAPPSSCFFYDISNDMASLQGGTITPGIYQPCESTTPDCYYATNTKSSGNSHIYGVNQAPGTAANTDVLGFVAGPGYDDATGLGSININHTVNNWNSVSPAFTTTTALSASVTTLTNTVTSTTLTSTVTATQRGGVPAGTVSFYIGSTSGTLLGTSAVTANACTGTGATTVCTGSATFTLTATPLASGANNVIAYFNGDAANDGPSTSSAVVITNNSATAATITSPANGSTLTGLSTTFTWQYNTSTDPVYLHIGTTGVGSTDLVNIGPITGGSTTVNLPSNGATIYVELESQVNGVTKDVEYTYTEASQLAATITSPTGGSTLSGQNVTFTWTLNSSTAPIYLHVGTTVGGTDLVNIGPLSGTSTTVTLPVLGAKIYVTLESQVNGVSVDVPYTYTEASNVAATITSPTNGSTLSGQNVTFTWALNGSAAPIYLHVGTTVGGTDLVNIGPLSGTSTTVTLPVLGATIYATLESQVNGVSVDMPYTYTEASQVAASITSPANGSTLTGASTTFTWVMNGSTAPVYLHVGTTVGGTDLVNIGPITGGSTTVSLPVLGNTVYVTLESQVNGVTVDIPYTYTETSQVAASITSPANGSQLGSTQTFTWVYNGSTDPVYLHIGSTPGGIDIVNLGPITGGSTTVNLPTDGATVYVTLESQVNGQSVDVPYTYTDPTTVSPSNNSHNPSATHATSAAQTVTTHKK